MLTSLDSFYEGVDSRIEDTYNLLGMLGLIEAPGRDTTSETHQSQFQISQTTHSMEDYLIYGRDHGFNMWPNRDETVALETFWGWANRVFMPR